jgi:hypothetical protein
MRRVWRPKSTKEQIENSPEYDKKSLRSGDEWKKYEQEFKKYWDEEPVMHIKGSDRIITPPDAPLLLMRVPAGRAAVGQAIAK